MRLSRRTIAGLAAEYRVTFPPKLESRKFDVGTASVNLLVDTPTAQVIGVAPKGSDTLSARAEVLASLMVVDGAVKNAIAQRECHQTSWSGSRLLPPTSPPRRSQALEATR